MNEKMTKRQKNAKFEMNENEGRKFAKLFEVSNSAKYRLVNVCLGSNGNLEKAVAAKCNRRNAIICIHCVSIMFHVCFAHLEMTLAKEVFRRLVVSHY